MTEHFEPSQSERPARGAVRPWREKFGTAFRGAKRGMRGQSSFAVHLFVAAAVIVAAAALRVSRDEWCLLVLAIALVLAAEMFNSALEHFSRALGREFNPHLADALDIGSAAVLLAAVGAAALGLIVFVPRFAALVGWWPAG